MTWVCASVERALSVSSMRSRNFPPSRRAKSQLKSAVRAPPTWRYPVGEGAKRSRGFGLLVISDSRMKSGSTLEARTRRAEREGFEPSIRVSTYAGLANRCLKPLGHLSWRISEVIGASIVRQPFAYGVLAKLSARVH